MDFHELAKKIEKALVILLITCCCFSCRENSDVIQDCVESLFYRLNLEEYILQKDDCRTYLELYHYNNEQYFIYGNACYEVESTPLNCNLDLLCDEPSEEVCQDFFENAERIKVIGFVDWF